MIKEARLFATEKHGNQKYGEHPYTYHLAQVAEACAAYAHDPICEVVAWLHDVVEDTPTTVQEVQEAFGISVANAVSALTDKPGINREQRHLNTYYLIRGNAIALQVKLCDRLCNMRESVNNEKLKKMYVKEYMAFKYCFYEPGFYEDLWDALDEAYENLKC